ncbi:Gag-like protein [Plakobranchus ocellatus]|uniref:Gag-like protein n=1 Tax=Plakobranchus ocellatus TaxID=259542 RepID=A0AAV4BB41_9GAST|nr:Gag-like protein [Plakobranchus ocellatus]
MYTGASGSQYPQQIDAQGGYGAAPPQSQDFQSFSMQAQKDLRRWPTGIYIQLHRELKSILGDETIEVTKLGSNDLMVELKSNDQAKKLGAIATFLDIPVTVSPHKSLNSSKGVSLSRDLRCCSEEEMV